MDAFYLISLLCAIFNPCVFGILRAPCHVPTHWGDECVGGRNIYTGNVNTSSTPLSASHSFLDSV